MLNDQGQEIITHRSPQVLPPARRPRVMPDEDTLARRMLEMAKREGHKSALPKNPIPGHKGGFASANARKQRNSIKSQVIALMKDDQARTCADVADAIGITREQASSAMNIAKGPFVNVGREGLLTLYRYKAAQ